MIRIVKTYWPSIIVVIVIIYATWFPEPVPYNDIPSIPHIDKLIHAIMFGGLTGALMFDYYRARPSYSRLRYRVIIAISSSVAAFGVFDEVVQGFLGIGRPSDVIDILADCVGILVAIFIAPPVIKYLIGKKSKNL